jgi:periplasmic divalent cation tolerance protein
VGPTEPGGATETPGAVVCLVTAPTDHGRAIAAAIVERRIAACVNIVPVVESVYRWQDAVTHDSESLLVIKTTRDAVDALIAALGSLHPYENFELVALDVAAGAAAYLRWIDACVQPSV